ncbi:hypothetical protein M8S10_13685 [Enterobacter chuandaensis]|nr:hypothetical protein [Enterobacter chuandaensis]
MWDESTKSWYYWSGNLPKSVPEASSPESTGGVSLGAWQSVGDFRLRDDLAKEDGLRLIGECQDISTLRTIEPYYNKQRITLREHTNGTGMGGGQFRAVIPGDAYTDNNGTIIKTTGGSAWIRTNSEVVTP